MICGHLTWNSKMSARSELESNPTRVNCCDCGEVTELHLSDYSFDDQFGGVSDFRVETNCCDSTEWLTDGCMCCGEKNKLTKHTDGFWYCSSCREEVIKEERERDADALSTLNQQKEKNMNKKNLWKCQNPRDDIICRECRHAPEHKEETGCHRPCGPFGKVCGNTTVAPIKKNGGNGKAEAKPAEILNEIGVSLDKLAEEADKGVMS